MSRFSSPFFTVFILLTLLGSPCAFAQKAIWAKQAIPLDFSCTQNAAKSQRIASPDGNVAIEVKCRPHSADADPTYYLHVAERTGHARDFNLDEGAHELLWSQDSKAFLVNGGTSAISGFFVKVYLTQGLRKLAITNAAQRDMVTSFPPCRAFNRDESLCKKIENKPEYNMSGISWLKNSSAVVVIAEVPCSSAYGGIMCQVLGYEIAVPTGKIVRRLTALELKRDWQDSMAWDMRVPDAPEYGAPFPQSQR